MPQSDITYYIDTSSPILEEYPLTPYILNPQNPDIACPYSNYNMKLATGSDSYLWFANIDGFSFTDAIGNLAMSIQTSDTTYAGTTEVILRYDSGNNQPFML